MADWEQKKQNGLQNHNKSDQSIDAVITWVDGNDPIQIKKRNKFISQHRRPGSGTEKTRFREEGEIEFCIVSILKFIPWIRRIFIVTDGQVPSCIDKLPKSLLLDKIKIIDHREIFRNLEEHLPVFNSRSIETCIWRIPDLSERYIYFNDDFMILRPLSPDVFFNESKLVLRGRFKNQYKKSSRWLPFLSFLRKGNHTGNRRAQCLAAKKVGIDRKFFKADHVPHPQFKSLQQQFYSENPEIFKKNIKFRFRSSKQFVPTAIAYHLAFKKGLTTICREHNCLRLKMDTTTFRKLEKNLSKLNENGEISFMCVQSLDLASRVARNKILDWLRKNIGTVESFSKSVIQTF